MKCCCFDFKIRIAWEIYEKNLMNPTNVILVKDSWETPKKSHKCNTGVSAQNRIRRIFNYRLLNLPSHPFSLSNISFSPLRSTILASGQDTKPVGGWTLQQTRKCWVKWSTQCLMHLKNSQTPVECRTTSCRLTSGILEAWKDLMLVSDVPGIPGLANYF